ncbi:MAG TPA: hypothetical protein VLE27_04050 [Thermoanaerobaculia bacterium]|nr:hypothetical protein [Thermoanaerobaculia bacterium]
MKAFPIKADVAPDGELRVVTRVPADIPPGEHHAMLILEESVSQPPPGSPRPPLRLKAFSWQGSNGTSFRREDIYGDDGR